MDLDALTTVVAGLDEHILTVTLDRPERMNSFTNEMRAEFRWLWEFAREEDDVHVIVLRGAGDRAFSTGMDTREGTFISDNVFSRRDPGGDLAPKQNGCWKPLICAVHGMAAGGALYWLNEADIIVASEDAQFFDPHVSYGLVAALEPIGLAHRIPIGEVLRMVLLGLDERMSAARAREIGFVSEVVTRAELWPRVHALAQRVAAKPPAAIQGSVRAIWESRDTGRSQALATGMSYTSLGNPIGKAQVVRSEVPTRSYEIR
ncbi:enoyl-CoA hydratase/isomerase family protein [Gordonia sp. CPCC 206044]|uniref:enoyl-CoA hydratase/isomerase family protein n=1 Tax=Gordonia sp. CPCC 206044 TaxID=3140793 RepID=UPI003AF401A2